MPDSRSDDTLSRRRLLTSLATIAGSTSAAGVGTWALFSDRERSDLTVSAGTVTLDAGDDETPTITFDDIEAGGSGDKEIELTNTGSLAGDLRVCIDDVTVSESSGGGEDSPVSHVEFNGCGQAEVQFDREPDEPVSVTFEFGDGTRETRAIGADDLKGQNWYKKKRKGGKNGYIERVIVGGRTWVNDACNHVDASTTNSDDQYGTTDASLAEDVSVSIGIDSDLDDDSSETLFEDSVKSLGDRGCEPVSTTLGSGETTNLVVGWDAEDGAGPLDGTIDIELTVTLQS